MEHLLFLLIEFILWVDRRSLKPLNKVLPNLSELRARPTVVLAEGDVTIGPVRRWGSAIALGLLLGFCLVLLGGLLLLAVPGPVGRPLPRGARILLLTYLMAAPLLSILFLLHRLKGARLVLRSGGVEIHDRGSTILCPWALFGASGIPLQSAKDRVLLPVEPTAIPFVEVQRDDHLLARGGRSRIRTRALRFKTANLAEMRALYQVELPEVAMLLLELGRQLATPLPRTTPDHLAPLEVVEPLEMSATLVRQADGWLKASLVHLTFPPYCCDCGVSTPQRKEYQGFRTGTGGGSVAILESGDSAKLEVPFCHVCQEEAARTWRKALRAGIAVGLLCGFVVAALICVLVGDTWMLLMAVPLGILGILLGAVIGNSIGKSLASPVRLRGYAPEEGTMLLLFRNADYADALVEIHNGVSEEVPAEADATDDVYSER